MEKPTLHIHQVDCRNAPRSLLLEADPSETMIDTYLPGSACYVAEASNTVVGVYVMQRITSTTQEIRNIAVRPDLRGQGIGQQLLRHAIATARHQGATNLEVGTGSFGYPLTFYQKAGFRIVAIETDYFVDHYDDPIFEQGLQHRDRLRLRQSL